jgi:fructose-bisphosphate aldolase class II
VSLERTATLIAAAQARGRAVPAFNVVSLDQAEAVVAGAADAGVATLLQVSENAIVYHGGYAPLLCACRELAVAADVPVGIHVDHVEDPDLALAILDRAVELGVGSLMFDASALPYEQNVALTVRIADRAHALGIWLEGELGRIGGKDGAHAPGVRTDPEEAVRFADETGIDGLAVAVGSSHAMTTRTAALDHGLIRRLAAAVGRPLVLHGSSGVPDAALADAVEAGMRKINVGTALGAVGTAQLRADLSALPDAVDPRKYSAGARAKIRELVAHVAAVVG